MSATQGEFLERAGCDLVIHNTNEEWKQSFMDCAASLLRAKGSLTSEEITGMIGYPPGHVSAIGACMRAFAATHKLICVYEKSKRSTSHAAIIGRWS